MASPSILPPGSWPSPLTALTLARGTLRLSSPRLDHQGNLLWLEGRPDQGGRTVLCRQGPDGTIDDLTAAPLDVRSRVHEYGAGAYALLGEDVVLVNASDQTLHRLRPGQPGQALTQASGGWRFADLSPDPARRRILAVAERHLHADRPPDNLIVAVGLDDGAVTVLVEGADFYASPTVSPDGRQLAWLSWNHPHLPWDAAALHLADLDCEGTPTRAQAIAGDAAASAQQPRFTADDRLYFLLEREGLWNLHRWAPEANGADRVQPVGAIAAELGLPLWQLGTSSWGLLDEQTALAAGIDKGLTALYLIDLGSGQHRQVPGDLVAVSDLTCRDGRAALIAGFADRPSALVRLKGLGQPSPGLSTVRASLVSSLAPTQASRAEAFSYPTSDGDTAHGFFYPPHSPQAAAPADSRPPLLVSVHGGPTGATTAAFNPVVQYFTTRGFAVLDVNYRGSTGYGRPYRDRLRGQWGVYDVDDCLAGVRALIAAGRVDAERVAIRGSSAGGYTVLASLIHPQGDLFRAGACLYGVSDLGALARDTHKFESRYLDSLVGKWPERADLYAERSPINRADQLRTPVIFFQGLDDRVVPPDQTRRLAEALSAKGLPAPYHAFAGEAHGFRRAETMRAVYEAELAFYRQIFGITSVDSAQGT